MEGGGGPVGGGHRLRSSLMGESDRCSNCTRHEIRNMNRVNNVCGCVSLNSYSGNTADVACAFIGRCLYMGLYVFSLIASVHRHTFIVVLHTIVFSRLRFSGPCSRSTSSRCRFSHYHHGGGNTHR